MMETLENQTTRISIVEDNDVVREGFVLLINSVDNLQVISSFSNCEDAIKQIKKDPPHIIMMDLELPGMSGIEGIKIIKKDLADPDIIVITDHEESKLVFDALCAGACGYLTKTSNYSKLLQAIDEVKNGGSPMTGNIARMVVESFQRNNNSPLTRRETEVMEMLSKGKSYSIIAEELYIHKETVKSHIKNIYYKLQVNSKAAAIEKALKEKLI